MAEDGNLSSRLYIAHELVAAARDHEVDQVVERKQGRDGVPRCHELDSSSRDLGLCRAERSRDGIRERREGVQRLLSA